METPPEGDHRHPAGFWEVQPESVRERLEKYRVVDVREPDEFTGPLGHIPGADLVPLRTLEDATEDWDRDQPLLVVCKMGGRSARACALLQGMGFEHLTNLVGGMTRWSQLGYETEAD